MSASAPVLPAAPVHAGGEREQVLALIRQHVNSGMARLGSLMNLPLECHSAGVHVVDQDGRRYLDVGGYGVFLLGHAHPAVVAAVVQQVKRHAMSTRLLLNPYQARAAAALAAICPPGLQYVYFCNSGAEACEAALKLARLNGCETVISTHGGFHGKTLGALSVTGRDTYRAPFGTMLNPSQFVDFGDAGALEQALRASAGKACVILEPVQAEAGVIVPPPGYLREVRALCDRYQAVLIFDEIQCGMGRSGKWWACDHAAVAPDILLAGKILSGGCVPVGAMIATAAVYAPFNRDPLLHTSTYGGNPLAMAAVLATIGAIRDENLLARTHALGCWLLDGITQMLAALALQDRVQVRASGLLLGLAFPEAHQAAQMVTALLEAGVIVSHSLNEHRVVRLTPAALMTYEDASFLLCKLADALSIAMRDSPR
ncbi:MAG: aminotransferase class III-fold pyridoxal phosphate-dependent enzyme [Pseudomonadota bacterium]|nr:aminotransferase class III-fold pyridoxal phosphate-dependent enzyme [Pseudomonadota bacterium]